MTEEWQSSWPAFVQAVVDDFGRGLDEGQVSKKYAHQEVEWEGKVLRLDLDYDENCGPFAQLRMEPVRLTLPDGRHAKVHFLAIRIDRSTVLPWHGVAEGDTIRFRTHFIEGIGPFKGIEIFDHGSTSRFDLVFSTRSSEFVALVKEADPGRVALDIGLHSHKVAESGGFSFGYLLEKPIGARQRNELKRFLAKWGVSAPFDQLIGLDDGGVLELSFIGLESESKFCGGGVEIQHFTRATADFVYSLADIGGFAIDVGKGLDPMLTSRAAAQDISRACHATFVASPDELHQTIMQAFRR
jgi:hypothetical protein